MKHKNGTIIDTENTVTTLYDDQGWRTGVISVIRDITQRKQAEKRLQHRLTVEEAVAQVSKLLFAVERPDFQRILEIMGKAVAANRSYLFRLKSNEQLADNLAEWCASGTSSQIHKLQNLDISLFPWWMEQLEEREYIAISDMKEIPPQETSLQEILQEGSTQSLLCVPIRSSKGKLAGLIGFDDTTTSREWNQYDIQALQMAAEMVSIYWERKQAESEKETFQRLVQKLSSPLT